jgi:hypothetical protein
VKRLGSSRLRWMVGTALGAVVALPVADARADEGDACLDSSAIGQKLEKDGKLIEARERFAQCANDRCAPDTVAECTRSADRVDEATPSIVVIARDDQGRELGDVLVSIDGAAPVSAGARGIVLDPGPHRFAFQLSGRPDVVEEAVVNEGEKNREVIVSYPSPPPPKAEDFKVPVVVTRPVPALAWIAGGVAVVGVALFGTFEGLGVGVRGMGGCANGCSGSEKSSVDTDFDIADVALGVGIAALGLAAWQFIARPSVSRTSTAAFDFRLLPGGGVATVGARF